MNFEIGDLVRIKPDKLGGYFSKGDIFEVFEIVSDKYIRIRPNDTAKTYGAQGERVSINYGVWNERFDLFISKKHMGDFIQYKPGDKVRIHELACCTGEHDTVFTVAEHQDGAAWVRLSTGKIRHWAALYYDKPEVFISKTIHGFLIDPETRTVKEVTVESVFKKQMAAKHLGTEVENTTYSVYSLKLNKLAMFFFVTGGNVIDTNVNHSTRFSLGIGKIWGKVLALPHKDGELELKEIEAIITHWDEEPREAEKERIRQMEASTIRYTIDMSDMSTILRRGSI